MEAKFQGYRETNSRIQKENVRNIENFRDIEKKFQGYREENSWDI